MYNGGIWGDGVDMSWSVMFGEWIGEVFFAWWSIINPKLLLADATFEPMPSHVHGFGSILFYGAVGKTFGSGVVSLHGGGRLRVPKFGEGVDDWHRILAIQIARANLGLCGQSNNHIDDLAHCVDGTVEGWDGIWGFGGVDGLCAEKEMSGSTAVCACF
jgi:hypothetical protein